MRRRHPIMWPLFPLLCALIAACGTKATKPPTPRLVLGMTGDDFKKELPLIKHVSAVNDGWRGNISSIEVWDHANEHLLLQAKSSDFSVTLWHQGRATTHIRPDARRPLREVIAFLEKDIPALLSKAGWKETSSFADHWSSVLEHKCAPANGKKLIRWELDMDNDWPDQLEFAVLCETLDLDSPASWFVTINSGGSMLKTIPRQ